MEQGPFIVLEISKYPVHTLDDTSSSAALMTYIYQQDIPQLAYAH